MLTDTYMYYVRKDKACQEETNTHTLCQDKGSYRHLKIHMYYVIKIKQVIETLSSPHVLCHKKNKASHEDAYKSTCTMS